VSFVRQYASSAGQLEQGHAFLGGAARDAEEVSSVGFREPPVALGDIGRDEKGGSIELIAKKGIAAGKPFSRFADLVGEVDRLLVDELLLEGLGQGGFPKGRQQ
jgi:hypothetical protein